MRKYYVEVNGTPYQVGITEMTDETSKVKDSNPVQMEIAPRIKGAENITSPMPGTIFKINVKKDQIVKAGDILLILEAMKMENEIISPINGTVTYVGVQEGTSVESGDILCSIS